MLIYKLISPSNKFYIGKTKYNHFIQRWRQHLTLWKKLSKIKNYKDAPTKLYYAFDKYPPKEWAHEILWEGNNLEELNQKEIEFIELLDSIKTGYNITKGGDGRLVDFLEEEHKKKISEARKKWFQTEEGLQWKEHLRIKALNNHTFGANTQGILKSKETKQKISQTRKGKKIIPWHKGKKNIFSKEVLIKISEKVSQAHKDGKYIGVDYSSYKIGKPRPESQKQKVREANQKEWNFIDPTGNHIHFINLRQFCRENRLDQGNMTKVHTGQYKSCKGWTKA